MATSFVTPCLVCRVSKEMMRSKLMQCATSCFVSFERKESMHSTIMTCVTVCLVRHVRKQTMNTGWHLVLRAVRCYVRRKDEKHGNAMITYCLMCHVRNKVIFVLIMLGLTNCLMFVRKVIMHIMHIACVTGCLVYRVPNEIMHSLFSSCVTDCSACQARRK